MQTEILKFLIVLTAKCFTGWLGCWAENGYHTHRHLASAIGTTFCVGIGIPVSHKVIVDNDPTVIVAMLIAVFITTYHGATDLERRKLNE